jgi:hypothetical protein
MPLFSLIKYAKFAAPLVALVAGVGAWYGITSHYEEKGYLRALDELQIAQVELLNQATAEAVAKAEIELAKALKDQQAIHDTEILRTMAERKVEKETTEILKNVDKVIVKKECHMVSPSAILLLNDSIDNINKAIGGHSGP